MRISDWSSDVCSSDLQVAPVSVKTLLDGREELFGIVVAGVAGASPFRRSPERGRLVAARPGTNPAFDRRFLERLEAGRSAERRVGKECVSPCSYRWSPYH